MKRYLLLVILSTFIIVATNASSYSPAEDLNAAFGAGCSTNGAFSSTIDANAAAIKGMLDSMRNDDACKGLTPLFDSVTSDIKSSLDNRDSDQSNEESLSAYINDLNAAVAVEELKGSLADADYITALKAELQTKKIELLQVKRVQEYSAKTGSHQQIKHLYTATSVLMDGLISNKVCADKYPNILAQIGAQILKISSDYTTGLTGSPLMAAGTIVDKLVTFVRDFKLASSMNDIEQENLGRAIGCAFESISKTYCQARDVDLVAKKQAAIKDSVPSCGWEGVDLIGRDMSIFLDWVSRLYAGSEPSSTSQAYEQITGSARRCQLDTLDKRLQGAFADTEKKLNQTTDSIKKQQILIALLTTDVVPEIKSNSNSRIESDSSVSESDGPIEDAFAEDQRCGALAYFYTSGNKRKCAIQNSEECMACVQRENPGISLDLNNISATWKILRAEAAENVSNIESRVKEQNPALVMALADDLSNNQRRPRNFLENARSYLQNILSDQNGIAQGAAKKTIELALSRVKCALELYNEYSSENSEKSFPSAVPSACQKVNNALPNKDAQYYVTNLSELLAPSGDTNSLTKEIKVIVKKDIDKKIESGQIDESLAAIMKLSTTDSLSEFLKDYNQNFDMLESHISSVKSASRRQLKVIWDVFGDSFIERLKGLRADAANSSDEQKVLNKECARLLVLPFGSTFRGEEFEMPSEVTKYCKGCVYESSYANSGLSINFDTLSKHSFEERACVLYDFFRKSELYVRKKPYELR